MVKIFIIIILFIDEMYALEVQENRTYIEAIMDVLCFTASQGIA